jgi:hypothetical protein
VIDWFAVAACVSDAEKGLPRARALSAGADPGLMVLSLPHHSQLIGVIVDVAVEELRRLLSPARLAEYEHRFPSESVRALRLHCWNTELCGAMYEILQFLEVGLRNSIHVSLSERRGREDWWACPALRLHRVSENMIFDATDTLVRTKGGWAPDDVVAQLPFGFWVGLFARHYEHVLWYRGLRAAVPGYRAHRRDPLYRELDRLRTLRNRIAHHRPIYHRHLAADHESALRLLGYLGGGLETMVAKHSRVPGLLARGPR